MTISVLAALLFIGILLLLVWALAYLAREQTTHRSPYGSWSQIFLRPNEGLGTILDTRDKLQKQISSANRQSHKHQNSTRNRLRKNRSKEARKE